MRWKKIALSSGRELSFFSFLHSNISSFILSRDRTWAAYKILLYLAPQLKKVLDDPDPASLNTFLSQVSFSLSSYCIAVLNELLF